MEPKKVSGVFYDFITKLKILAHCELCSNLYLIYIITFDMTILILEMKEKLKMFFTSARYNSKDKKSDPVHTIIKINRKMTKYKNKSPFMML